MSTEIVHRLAFGTTKFYIVPYGKINYGLVDLSYNYDVKSGLNIKLLINHDLFMKIYRSV